MADQGQAAAGGIYSASPEFVAQAHVDAARYDAMYAASVADPDGFWAKEGLRLDWTKPYSRIKNSDFTFGRVSIKWFEDGTLNVCANCVD
ncbi:MAG: acetyl-coenzyme A synthetase N-terminal domain-containing protein, partial [Gemmobacter sp.]